MEGWKQGRWLILAVVGVALGLSIRADDQPYTPGSDSAVPNFSLRGSDGRPVSLDGLAGKIGTVLFFTGNSCPNSNKYLPRMIEIVKRYESRGIVFLGINSNASETSEEVVVHTREHGISFPVLKDPNNLVADLLRVDRTSEVVMLDRQFIVRYQGSVDDQFGQGTNKPSPSKNYLTDALEATLAGEAIRLASSPAIGCPIERVERKLPKARIRPAASSIVEAFKERTKEEGPILLGPVNYTSDVAPIVFEKCQSCHRPGQVGPFALMSYDDIRKRADGIAEVVTDRRMPPWHADPRFGHFANDRSLTPRERATLLTWVEQGSPLGDPTKLPPPRSFPEGWSIGLPDVVFAIPEPNEVPASGVMDYIDVVLPSNFDRDTWIQAAEVRPEARSVVHHIIVYVEIPNEGRRDRREHLAAYVPGDTPTYYPSGIAKMIPAGSKLHFQIHYTPDGTARTDRSMIGLIYAKTPVQHRAYTRFIQDTKFEIPANDNNYEVKSSQTFRSDFHLYSLSPHMHLRGKDFQYTATYPGGKTELLLSVPAYDFGWQSAYVLSEPKALPKGTRIDCVAHFDNSSNNPANPDPTRAVKWGEQSTSEMMMGYLDYVNDGPSGWKP